MTTIYFFYQCDHLGENYFYQSVQSVLPLWPFCSHWPLWLLTNVSLLDFYQNVPSPSSHRSAVQYQEGRSANQTGSLARRRQFWRRNWANCYSKSKFFLGGSVLWSTIECRCRTTLLITSFSGRGGRSHAPCTIKRPPPNFPFERSKEKSYCNARKKTALLLQSDIFDATKAILWDRRGDISLLLLLLRANSMLGGLSFVLSRSKPRFRTSVR